MNNLQLKISLPGTDPLVWREVVVSPKADLDDLHTITQAVMDWDNSHMYLFRDKKNNVFDPEEDEYYDVELNEVLPRKGSKLLYVYDFGDNWEHLIEVVAKVPQDERDTPYLVGGANAAPPEDSGGIPGYRYKLDILADPSHPDYEETLGWMTGAYDDPFDPLFFDLKDTALYLREVMESMRDDLLHGFGGSFSGDEMGFIDIDQGRERTIEFAWLKKEHGIPLTEEHIRNTPKEIIDFLEIAEAEDDPQSFLKEAERLHKKHPGEPNIHMALLAMYHYLGKDTLATRLEKTLPDLSPDDVLFNLGFIMQSPDEDTFMKRMGRMPQPLKLTNLPPGKGGLYHADEFLLFETLAIRYALDKKQLDDAVDRLDRLVKAGYLHSELRGVAFMIAGEQLQAAQSLIEEHRNNPGKPIPKPSAPVAPRTQKILESSMHEVLGILDSYGSMGWEEDEIEDDYPNLSLAHSARRPQEPHVAVKKIGRNEPCPCGSGKKYKKCCG